MFRDNKWSSGPRWKRQRRLWEQTSCKKAQSIHTSQHEMRWRLLLGDSLETLSVLHGPRERRKTLIRNLAIIIYIIPGPPLLLVLCVLSPEIDMALSCGPKIYLFPLLIHSSPLFSFSLSRSPYLFFFVKRKRGKETWEKKNKEKGGLMKEKDKNLTQRKWLVDGVVGSNWLVPKR